MTRIKKQDFISVSTHKKRTHPHIQWGKWVFNRQHQNQFIALFTVTYNAYCPQNETTDVFHHCNGKYEQKKYLIPYIK